MRFSLTVCMRACVHACMQGWSGESVPRQGTTRLSRDTASTLAVLMKKEAQARAAGTPPKPIAPKPKAQSAQPKCSSEPQYHLAVFVTSK
jgi:hypothetical protein